jgi:hypothetical protein
LTTSRETNRHHNRHANMVKTLCWVHWIISLSVLIVLAACQSNGGTGSASEPLPSLIALDQEMTLPVFTEIPATRELRAVVTRDVTLIPTALPTFTPRAVLASLTPTMLSAVVPVSTVDSPTLIVPTLELLSGFVFGMSRGGKPLAGRRFGTGDTKLMFVGGVHTGFEANTVELMNELIAHFEVTPDALLPGISLIFIPALNPDGLTKGRVLQGRFNDQSVDLNRNWGCGWEPVAYFQQREVSPGERAFSEPETQALADFIQNEQPAAVLFYHAAADGIFSGECDGQDAGSAAMSTALSESTGYPFGDDFSNYAVSGTAPEWVVSQGIASADVELASATETEFERNLRGVMALQCWGLSIDIAQCEAAGQ